MQKHIEEQIGQRKGGGNKDDEKQERTDDVEGVTTSRKKQKVQDVKNRISRRGQKEETVWIQMNGKRKKT